ncbi:uncharacterized protein LOC109707491 isoform X1 [Ananas comosus]|uniref:Uncharacterized protein LOC109707491 isoform X1 n=1 Tax=Ananas comosus TaxID=4615 RepID=A0A6P5EST4_ANACO|nr:uncharacterized protein LOC109707491 isoform X1 [Ananas comosus]XP_020084368.1 uncharacterized protein LOC109707491 isoform X1 [Ananas comosus]XP_020084369.1 uncharacterized protein LOC109707491 isoform X1 [Ananas comosus]
MGKMINLFELSAGMTGTKLLTDRAHRDGSPVRKNRPEAKEANGPGAVHADDKSANSDPRRSSSAKKSGGTPMKMLIAQEMSTETESKRKPPSVVAKLMGLDDDLPAPPASKRSSQEDRCLNKPTPCEIHSSSSERIEYKDVYEVWQQPSRPNYSHDRQSEKRMDLVRQKFMEAKRLATDERLLQSKEFQEALEVLSSNRDIFLKFLEEPNSLFSKQIDGLHTIPPPPRTKRITVLKPAKSVEVKVDKLIKKQQYPNVDRNGCELNKPYWRSSLTNSKSESFSQPTRIVVLKPSPAKAQIVSQEVMTQNDLYGGLGDIEAKSYHRRDESLLSSVFSNGYGGDDSSFNRSENEYIEEEEEEEGGSFSDSEIVTPTSRHSWDYINKFGSPYSASSFSRASYSPESSVIREAKKRLSERWALVAANEIIHEEIQVPRSSSTLGDMLAIPDVKKKEEGSRSYGAEHEFRAQNACLIQKEEEGEGSPRNLSRSKSVPVSSSVYDNVGLNAQVSNSQDSRSIVAKEAARPNKGKSFFRSFFSRSKKPGREGPSPSLVGPGKVHSPCMEASSNDDLLKPDDKSFPDESPVVNSEEEFEKAVSAPASSVSKQGTVSSKATLSLVKPTPSDYPFEIQEKSKSSNSPRIYLDQPSPTSVLDALIEDANENETPSHVHANTGNQQAISRSPAIESVARSLSWEDADAHMETPSFIDPPDFLRTISRGNVDEQERFTFVQNLLSSSVLNSEKPNSVFAGWHSIDCPLNPNLLDKFLDRKEEAAKSRERRSNQRLLFDCVNAVLLEIGHSTLLGVYPWGKAHTVSQKSALLAAEVWDRVKNWFSNEAKFVHGESENAGVVVERVTRKEIEGNGWAELMRFEVNEISREIGGEVLEQLVGEALMEFAAGCCL